MSDTGPKTLLEAVRHFTNLDVCHEYMRGTICKLADALKIRTDTFRDAVPEPA